MAFSVMALINKNPGRCALALDYGDAFIVHCRNKLADHFLSTGLDWMLTVDDDTVIPFGDASLFNAFTRFNVPDRFAGFNVLDRLLAAGKTLVGALYFSRWPNGNPVYAEGADAQEKAFARRGPHDQVKPTRWVGTGCMLIHRSVLLDIEKKFPHLARGVNGKGGQWFTSSEHDLRVAVENAVNTLSPQEGMKQIESALRVSKRNSSLGMGEDVQFCIRATQAGHQPHVDLGCWCGHIGNICYPLL